MRLKDNMIRMTDTFVKADNQEIEIKVEAEVETIDPVNEEVVIEKNTVAKRKNKKATE
jgi:hypothetical protein